MKNPIFQDFVRGIFKIVIFGKDFYKTTCQKITKIKNFAENLALWCHKKRKNQNFHNDCTIFVGGDRYFIFW